MLKRIRSTLKKAVALLAGLVAVVMLLIGGAVLRLSAGPLDLPVPQALLDRVLADAAPGWRIEAGGARIDFSSDDPLNGLQFQDVSLFDTEGNSVIAAPRLGARFAVTPSLDPAEILTVSEIAVSGASVTVVRDGTGAFEFDISSNGGTGDSLPPLMEEEGTLDLLPRLRIDDARIAYVDLARGTEWKTDHAQLTLDPSSEGLRGTLGIALEEGRGRAVLDVFRHTGSGAADAVLTLTDMTPARIAGMHPVLGELARIEAPLTGTLKARLARDGAVESISADLKADGGSLRLHGEVPVELMAFSARLACTASPRRCDLKDFAIATPDVFGGGSGRIEQAGDDLYRAEVSLIAPRVRVVPGSAPIAAGRASVAATYDATSDMLEIEEAKLVSLNLTDLHGSPLTAERAEFSATVDAASMTADIRDWRLESVEGAVSDNASLHVATAKGSARVAGNIIEIFGLHANALGLNEQGRSHGIAGMTGAVTLDLDADSFALNADARNVRIETPDGGGGAAKTILRGRGSLSEGPLTIEALTASDIAVVTDGGSHRISALEYSGSVDPLQGALDDSRISLRDAVFALPQFYDAPVRVSQADAEFRTVASGPDVSIAVRDLVATIDGLPARGKGVFALRSDRTLSGRLEASLGPVDLARVPAHWPKPVAPGGLIWVQDNLKGGTADRIQIAAQFDTADDSQDALRLSFDVRDGTLTFVPGMPPITGARGRGTVTLDRFDVALDRGEVAPKGGGRLVLDGSSFAIPDLSPDLPDGEVSLRVTGGIQPVLHLLDTEPLGVISSNGVDIARTEGIADLRVRLNMPLAANLRIDDVRFDGRAEVRDFALAEPKTGAAISGDLLRVKATPEGLVLRSDARIDGVAARLDYRHAFERRKDRPEAILSVESFLSPDDLARMGFEPDAGLEGLAALDARVALYADGRTKFTADADLTGLAVNVDRLGWGKASGVPATLTLGGQREKDASGRIDALVLRGEGVEAEGTLRFDGKGDIRSARFSRILLDDSVDVGLAYDSGKAGNATLKITGARLDLRRVFQRAFEGSKDRGPGKPGPGRATGITLDVAQVRLRDGLAVLDARGTVGLNGHRIYHADLKGRVNGAASTTLRVERQSDGLALRLIAEDAGAFVEAADLFEGARGGRLMLDARTVDASSPAAIRGVIRFDDVVMRDAPAMRRILKGGGVASLLRQLASNGLGFTRIQLPFSGTGPVWRIDQGVAYGPALGLTLDGSYDLKARRLDLDGLVSPAYAINGALGNVPLLGKILTGGEGEGVFGVTFSVEGDADHPSVSVNPLSALAPGFLRKIVAEVGKSAAPAPRGDAPPRFHSGRD